MNKEWCQYCIWDIIYAKFLQNIRYNISKIYFKIIQEVSDYFTEDWLCQIPDSFETSEGVGWERINQFQSLQSKYEPVPYLSICSGKIKKCAKIQKSSVYKIQTTGEAKLCGTRVTRWHWWSLCWWGVSPDDNIIHQPSIPAHSKHGHQHQYIFCIL